MTDHITHTILKSTGAKGIVKIDPIQELWGGYGQILRYTLIGGTIRSAVVKHVQLPQAANHPRGWNTDRSHQRKLKSYQVEMNWYAGFGKQCNEDCRVPNIYQLTQGDQEMLMIMEDLNESGYPVRKSSIELGEIKNCLKWLAHFHSKFMGVRSDQLWEVGTYWHLDTRPDELEVMQDLQLKVAASKIDQTLNQAKYQTLVHGDAKLANFCFAKNGRNVAAVDFQYIGHGCGIKDVVYFLSSCLNHEELSRYESTLLVFYFKELQSSLTQYNSGADFEAIRQEWSRLYAFAWTDFYRFLDGWSPDHWKMHDYSKSIKDQVLSQLI